ncbi:LON peptidase substrate-binding domain-containing protein [Paracoccus aminophilus]|uniref:Peptidase S16 n=1 Tax=Paracoccus aminophilus JCM 7686 TaxID=1367847 RepID=S5Y3X0_PARAH|nr:LON peptidase substrate-binding domain-containing protein [Paracoccus aminophilus]AGT10435.1 peptidase S16 [Paracoccus aminophilus JCM 7686]
MLRRFDLPDSLPLFPLPGAVVMPRARLPLQIYEPRYLQMIEDALKTSHRLIGMIQPQEGALEDLAQVGTAARIVSFTEVDDGRYMITLGAVSRFRLTGVRPGFTPYLIGDADWSDYPLDRGLQPETDPGFSRPGLLGKLRRFMDSHELSTDWDAAETVEDEMLVNSLSMLLPFHPEEKQALLEARNLTERRQMLDGLLDYALLSGDKEETIQ